MEKDTKIFLGMMLGPRDFPDFKRGIISAISDGIEGAMKMNF